MKYTLTKVMQIAERHGVFVGIGPHQSITKTTEGLLRIANLVDSPTGHHYDGNSQLPVGTESGVTLLWFGVEPRGSSVDIRNTMDLINQEPVCRDCDFLDTVAP